MAFPTHARHAAIGSTNSLGVAECVGALGRIDRRRLGKTAAEVARALNPRQPATADVAAVLDGISSTLVTKSGSAYKLTRAGLKDARKHRPRRHFPFNVFG